jgi:hypothetical protein
MKCAYIMNTKVHIVLIFLHYRNIPPYVDIGAASCRKRGL